MRHRSFVKRIMALILVFMVLVSLCPFSDADVHAKLGNQSKDWGQKYIDYILEHQYDYLNGKTEPPYLYEGMTYELIYIDNDDIPEIFCSPKEDTGALIIYICGDEARYYQFPRKASMRYIEHEGVFEVSGADWTTGNYWGRYSYYTHIYELENGYIGETGSGSYAAILDENGYETETYEYEWDEEIVSKEVFSKEYQQEFNEKKASEYYSEMEFLPFDYNGIILETMKRSMEYSDIPWIKAYQDFLGNRKYLEMGQDYGNEVEIVGKLFDMDHDGIPEMILDNGYAGRALRSGYIYTYENGVIFLDNGPSEAYVDYEKGFEGTLYGFYTDSYYTGDGFLDAYHKKQNEITTENITEYKNVTNGFPVYKDYRYVDKDKIWILLKELSFYDSLEKEKVSNPTGAVADLHDLFDGIGWNGGSYDYRTTDSGDIDAWFLMRVMTEIKKYPGNIVEYEPYHYSNPVADPKNRFSYGYYKYDGEGLDWILKNIYNVDEKEITDLHKKDADTHYYYNQDYYIWMGGVGGGYGSYLDDIEDLGGVYQITYHQITIPDGPGHFLYDKKYALVAYKKIEGKGYWSLYKVSDQPLYKDAELIDVGFYISDKYKPYPIVAFKSLANNKYITCDIGSNEADGSYPQINSPSFNINADKIKDYEKFYYIILSDGKVVLQTYKSKKYVCVIDRKLTVSDYINDQCKFSAFIDGEIYRFKIGDYWLSCKNDSLFFSLNEKDAFFEKVLVDSNEYSAHEKNILSSGDWFNLDGKGVGYWDIQYQIGLEKDDDHKYNQNSEENVKALKELGYRLMYRRDLNHNSNTRTIEYDNMQCAIGVKKEDDIYDVIIAFQGTGGYADKTEWDVARDGLSNLTGDVYNIKVSINGKTTYVPCHRGYYEMAKKVFNNNPKYQSNTQAIAKFGNEEITLYSLINMAANGKAHFTILGHSMGGAIAQCFAVQLINYGVNPSAIRGRTYNSALALKNDVVSDLFTDWYNLCVISDGVPRGLVPGSIMKYGMHRLGRTIWLYDNEPEKDLDADTRARNKFEEQWYEWLPNTIGVGVNEGISLITNIKVKKHNMNWKLYDILLNITSSATYYGYTDVGTSSVYVTNKYNVPIYDRPKKDSDPSEYIDDMHTVVDMESYTYNDVGNKWYKTKEGKFIYSNNLEMLQKQSIGWSFLPDFCIYSDKAPMRAGCYNDTKVLEKLKKGTIIDVDYAVKNGGGNLWYHVTVNGKTGWIFSDHVQRCVSGKRIVDGIMWLISIDCPVNVCLYDSNDELVASIIDGEIYTADQRAVNPYMIGNGKYFEIFDEEAYYVEIDSLADGMMDYTISSDYDEKTGEYKSVKKFEAVDLEEEQYFDSKVGGDINAEDVYLRVVDEDGNVLSEIEAVTASDEESEGIDKKQIIIIAASAAAGLIAVIGIIAAVRKKRKKKEKISNE